MGLSREVPERTGACAEFPRVGTSPRRNSVEDIEPETVFAKMPEPARKKGISARKKARIRATGVKIRLDRKVNGFSG
jgi:hypothetical protein